MHRENIPYHRIIVDSECCTSLEINNLNNNNYSKNVENNLRVEEKVFQNSVKDENMDKENSEKACPVCQSASVINSKVRHRSAKKINPCLVEPQDIKYIKFIIIRHTIICCSHQSTQGFSIQELDPKNYKMMPPCLMEKIPAAGKANKMSTPFSLV